MKDGVAVWKLNMSRLWSAVNSLTENKYAYKQNKKITFPPHVNGETDLLYKLIGVITLFFH